MKYLLSVFCLFIVMHSYSQTAVTYEKPPVFENCQDQRVANLKNCFQFEFNSFVYSNFETPSIVDEESYQGEIKLLFEVDKEGQFQLIYVDAFYEELKAETQRIFDSLPKIQPATYNGNPTFAQYTTVIKIPLVLPKMQTEPQNEGVETANLRDEDLNAVLSNEMDSIKNSLVPHKKGPQS